MSRQKIKQFKIGNTVEITYRYCEGCGKIGRISNIFIGPENYITVEIEKNETYNFSDENSVQIISFSYIDASEAPLFE